MQEVDLENTTVIKPSKASNAEITYILTVVTLVIIILLLFLFLFISSLYLIATLVFSHF